MDNYQIKLAGEEIYHFMWDELANTYLEDNKSRNDIAFVETLNDVFKNGLKLLHPFMPFITETVWMNLNKSTSTPLIISEWPTNS